MQCDIRIRSPTYPITTELVVAHDSNETILTLKTKIKDGLQNPALVESVQKLIYAGHVLEDNKTLEQHNIPNSATFHLVTPPNIAPAFQPTQPTVEQTQDIDYTTEAVTTEREFIGHSGQDSSASSAVVPDDPLASIPSTPTVAEATGPASAWTSGPLSEQSAVDAIGETQSPSINLQGLAAPAHHFLAQQGDVQRTSLRYELCYIDGFPYLVKSTERRTRISRRGRPSTALGHQPQHSGSNGQSSNIVQPQTEATTIRQHHVDLPATAAIPVRTAEGQRALILSPEGVRAMAAQGVNVETAGANRAVLGVNSVAIRNFVSSNMPHAWLALKLAFIVGMLSTNSTWTRFLILNMVAIVIFLWQSGIFGRAFLGRANIQNLPQNVANQAQIPHAGRNAQAAHVTGADTLPDRATVHNRAASDTRAESSLAGAAHQSPPLPEQTWLQSFSNAFISSIMPGAPQRDTRLLRAPVNGMARANTGIQVPPRPEVLADQPVVDHVADSQTAPPASRSEELSASFAGASPSMTAAQSVGETSTTTNTNDRPRSENERDDAQAQLQENMRRDW